MPKSTIHERHAEHKRKAALNPSKRGPKPKVTRAGLAAPRNPKGLVSRWYLPGPDQVFVGQAASDEVVHHQTEAVRVVHAVDGD